MITGSETKGPLLHEDQEQSPLNRVLDRRNRSQLEDSDLSARRSRSTRLWLPSPSDSKPKRPTAIPVLNTVPDSFGLTVPTSIETPKTPISQRTPMARYTAMRACLTPNGEVIWAKSPVGGGSRRRSESPPGRRRALGEPPLLRSSLAWDPL